MARVTLALALVSLCLIILAEQGRGFRVKRRLDEFAQMIIMKTNRNPLDFNGYGNWCGMGGGGDTVDAIDECCKVHDNCYDKINGEQCRRWLRYSIYTRKYIYMAREGDITCVDQDPCARELCECDKMASTCFGENEEIYDTANKHSGFTKGLSRLLRMKGHGTVGSNSIIPE